MNKFANGWVVAIVAAATLHGVSAMGEETTSASNTTRSQPTSSSIENQNSMVHGINDARRVAGQFIVVLKKSTMTDYALRSGSADPKSALNLAGEDLSVNYGGLVSRIYGAAIDGFVLSGISDQAATALAADPRVDYVEADSYVSLAQSQSFPRWGLDRIDQRNLPLNNSYTYPNTGAGVNVYIVDSGIYPNNDFGGRVHNKAGYTAINDAYGTGDCNGHGTHVAGIVGSYTYGVAKSVNIYPVRVFDCSVSNAPLSQIIAGVNWVAGNYVKPAVVNMSLTAWGATSALDQATQSLLNLGIVVVAAAGNDGGDACQVSPAKIPGVITVGGSQYDDSMYSASNYGTCVDVYAPATAVLSTYNTGPTSTAYLDGTSMASPHVAGVAANFLAANPTASPASVATYIRDAATTRKVVNSAAGLYCANANALLFNGPIAPVGAPGMPTTLQAERICNGNYRMTWNAGAFPTADTYEIYRTVSSSPGCEAYMISTTGQSINVSTPSGFGTTFRVRGCNTTGCSAYSQPVSITPYSGCH